MPRGKTEDEILNERRPMDPLARVPFQRSNDTDYVVGSEDMMAPHNFEYMNRVREKQKEPTRLKKGGPVKKYEGGGMVEIEIKVGGKGKHKMPDGSMMEDDEMESEDYKKGGRIRKYAQGGEVDNSDRPEERGPVGLTYNQYLKALRAAKEMEEENKPASLRSEQAMLNLKKVTRGPGAGGPERLAREAAETETARRGRVASAQRSQRVFEKALEREGARIGQQRDPTRVEDNGYKKGGMVKPKAPVKKMAKGGVTNKKFIQQAIKKPGALRAQLGVKAGAKIPAKKLATAAKAPGKLGQRARFAQTLSKMKGK
jgi:hypothetical protein